MLLFWAVAALVTGCWAHPEVDLPQGKLRGVLETSQDGREYEAYWGIPYAKPPVGKHRFKESIPALPWLGVLNATRKPPDCLQYSHMDYLTPKPVSGQEDCLYINVFTPKAAERGIGALPVVVYIHGGAFMFLSGSVYEGTVLLDRDVVLVSLNYRLGPLGFLSTGDSVVPGNNGLKDQVLAMKWVQANIGAFGGDPNKVTIAGLSAGSASVHYHLLSPTTKGLFQAAILLSGVALNPWTQAEAAPEKAARLADSLGCPTNDTFLMIRCLRDRSAHSIVEQTSQFMEWLYNPFSPFAPVVEPAGPTAYLSESPYSILSSGRAHSVPILASYTLDEGLYPAAEILGMDANVEHLKKHISELLPHILDFNYTCPLGKQKEVVDKILAQYPFNLDTEQGVKTFVTMVGDRLFGHGLLKAIDLHLAHSPNPTYLFRFSYRGKFSLSMLFAGNKDLGVSHADDLFYILPSFLSQSQDTPEDLKMTRYMRDLWADFARDGKLPWKSGEMLDLRGPGQLVPIPKPDFSFWDTLTLEEDLPTIASKDEL